MVERPLIGAICVVGLSVLSCTRNDSDYGLAEWRDDRARDVIERGRSALGLEMHESGELIGKSRHGILDLLGTPDADPSSEELVYALGPDPSFGIDLWELRLEFDEDGRVRATAVDIH